LYFDTSLLLALKDSLRKFVTSVTYLNLNESQFRADTITKRNILGGGGAFYFVLQKVGSTKSKAYNTTIIFVWHGLFGTFLGTTMSFDGVYTLD